MKRNLSLWAMFLLLSTLIFSCSKTDSTPDPTADFLFEKIGDNVNAPATINFKNQSVGAITYSWSFGDGGNSSEKDPSHKYLKSGNFTITLTSSIGGKTSSSSKTINILPAYSKASISKFRITSVGEASAFTGFVRIVNSANNQLWKSANFTITPSALPNEWAIATPYVFTDLSQSYFFEVWKYGTLVDTKLFDSPFVPSLLIGGTNAANSYPASTPGLNGLVFGIKWQ